MTTPTRMFLLFSVVATTAWAQTNRIRQGDALVGPADLRMRGQYDQAIDAYRALLETDRSDMGATCGLATCYLETGRYAEALTALRGAETKVQAADTSPRERHAWHRAMATASAVIGEYTQAIAHAKSALTLEEHDLIARYLLGRLYEQTGRRDKAIETYKQFDTSVVSQLPDDAADLTAMAGGYLRYSVLTRHPNLVDRTVYTLRELYQRAYERVDRTYWPARLAAADLLRSKFRNDEAAKDYQAALRINENLASAHVGLGRIALDGWRFERVEHHLELANGCNPNSAPAFRLEAALRLTERRYPQALAAAERALVVNPRDIASLGYAAAAKYCLNQDQDVELLRGRAYEISPLPSAFHRILGDTLGALRQYAASEEQYTLAIAADPTDPHPRAELGLMYMQWGREQEARDALAAAWELDNFDTRTHNTLTLLDQLDSFATYDTDHFTIKYDASVDAVLPIYLAGYLESIHEELCEDYKVTLSTKTVIEVFPTHRMFGVRITGKPWIHTVGACTGSVIAIDSPRRGAKLQGPYDFARVLRHEYTHTLTLAASNNRIAHWFTEGLATFQEDAPRSHEWRRLLADAVRRNDLFTLESIDWAFVRPKRPNDRLLAYAQSEWMCEYIIERFGYASLGRMISGFRERKTQEQIIAEILGVTTSTFDQCFGKWARDQASTWGFDLTPLRDIDALREAASNASNDADAMGTLAQGELDAGNVEEAIAAARQGMAMNEHNVACLTVFGRALLLVRKEESDSGVVRSIDETLAPAMASLLDVDPRGWIAPKVLGAIALERGDYDSAVKHFARLKRVRPLDPAADRGLAGVYLKRGNEEMALPHLRTLAGSEQDDADIASTTGAIYFRKHQYAEARYWLTQSLYIDPFNVQTHESLAKACIQLNDMRGAVREYEALCVLQPEKVNHHERAARAHEALGQSEAAGRFARQALQLDATTSVRSLVNEVIP